MTRGILALIGLLIVLGCARTDPIERVVRSESANPYFSSGMFRAVPLPASASPQEVVGRVILGHAGAVTIVTNRTVQISSDSYTAALVQRSVGRQQVVLIRYEPEFSGWWNRVYGD